MLWRWVRGSKGLQTLEWVAPALLAALAFGLKRTEAGPGEALSAAVSAWFRCLIGQGDCPLTAVGLEKAGPCWTQPVGCLARWGDCLLRGACEGADPKDLLGLLPWLAVVGIPAGGVVFALLPPWARRRRWAWPRLTLPPPRVPLGRPSVAPSLFTPRPMSASPLVTPVLAPTQAPALSQMPTAMPEGAQGTPSPPSQPLTPVEKAGLIITGVVATVGIVIAEVTLIIVEVALLDLEPVGPAIDVFVITPIELFLIDVDVALWAMIYRSITTGEKQPVILWPLWGLEK